MPTPSKGYFNAQGKRVPGTTTVIGRFKDSGGLIHWAWDLGMQGINYNDVKHNAADIGTIAHDMVEHHIKDEPYTPPHDATPEMMTKATSAFNAFLSWFNQSRIEIIATEVQIVSEEYQFGGTPDAIGMLDGTYCLLDWKSSNGVYQDMLIQLSAYRYLWNECTEWGKDKPINGGYHLIRFAKEHGDFAHHYYSELDLAWEQFKLFRRAYDIDKVLKKRV